MPPQTPQGARRPTNVSLPLSLIEDARQLDINLSRACEQGILAAIKAERERRWQDQNKEAIEEYNRWVDENGLLLDEYRQF
ncbi:MAG: type II toxin-antitoxin system CcdA family antitoxin [Rhodopila sp.]|jgi:antitoxin CcdA